MPHPLFTSVPAAPALLGVVQLHVEEAALLRRQRSRLVRAPHIRLHLLARHDERMVAHLDGILVAGEAGRALVHDAASEPGAGEVFAAAVVALNVGDHGAIGRMVDAAAQAPEAMRGLISAFGWVSAQDLRGITRDLLQSRAPHARSLGLAACAMHGVDPGQALVDALRDADEDVVRRALDAAARLGLGGLRQYGLDRLCDGANSLRFHSARAALILGDRGASVACLREFALQPEAPGDDALALLLLALEPAAAHELLQTLVRADPAAQHRAVRSMGLCGQARYVPWLIQKCAEPSVARLAGEALSQIVGIDVDADGLVAQPEGGNRAPEAEDDENLDEQEDLLWPDAEKLQAWWGVNGRRFNLGSRYFVGAPSSVGQCLRVLATGNQRQRLAAAVYACLLQPGTPLFNTAAPAWRQQRRLAQMGV